MKTLAIVLGSLVVLGCGSEQTESYELDTHLAPDGIYGTFVQGDVRLEFASFEIESGIYAVTIVGEEGSIDTYYLPPERAPQPPSTRPMVDDGNGTGNRGGENGSFLLPPERAPAPPATRQLAGEGAQPRNTTGDFSFLLPPERRQQPAAPRGFVVGGESSGGALPPDVDIGSLGRGLNELFPYPTGAVAALIHVAELTPEN